MSRRREGRQGAGSGRGVSKSVLLVLPSGDVVVPVTALTLLSVKVVVMMVTATTIITMQSRAVRPAGGGCVSTVDVAVTRDVKVDPALKGGAPAVVVTTPRRRTFSIVSGAVSRVEAHFRTAVNGDTFHHTATAPPISGPRGAPSTNDSRPCNDPGTMAAVPTVQADA